MFANLSVKEMQLKFHFYRISAHKSCDQCKTEHGSHWPLHCLTKAVVWTWRSAALGGKLREPITGVTASGFTAPQPLWTAYRALWINSRYSLSESSPLTLPQTVTSCMWGVVTGGLRLLIIISPPRNDTSQVLQAMPSQPPACCTQLLFICILKLERVLYTFNPQLTQDNLSPALNWLGLC